MMERRFAVPNKLRLLSSRDIKVPGFRKGKVPASVAAKHVNPDALAQATLDNALSKAVAEVFTSEGCRRLIVQKWR